VTKSWQRGLKVRANTTPSLCPLRRNALRFYLLLPQGEAQLLNAKEQFLRHFLAKMTPPQMLCICITLKGGMGLCGSLLNHVDLRSDIILICQLTIPPPLRGTSFYTKEAWVCANFYYNAYTSSQI